MVKDETPSIDELTIVREIRIELHHAIRVVTQSERKKEYCICKEAVELLCQRYGMPMERLLEIQRWLNEEKELV